MFHHREDILTILAQALPLMRNDFDVKQVALFGSHARNEATKNSDIDILVEFRGKSTLNNFMGVQELLEKRLNYPVDLATNKAIKPNLLPYIQKDIIYVQ